MRGVDDVRLGLAVRAVRRRHGWRQADVAERAGLPQSTVSELERGQAEHLRLDSTRRIATVLGIRLDFDARWRGAELARLLDRDHAALVERVVAMLVASGWQVVTEYGFNHFGERGSVDALGWHEERRALFLGEIKATVPDVQAMRRSDERKLRLVPRLVAAERGWRALAVGQVLVVAEGSTNRRVVARHAATFGAAYPERGAAVRRWMAAPGRSMSGLLFLPVP